jgi:hypothetical protein
MKTLSARSPVKSGYYFSLKAWGIQPVEKDGGVLAGEADEKFLPISLPLAVALAPLLGAAFLMFMPFVGFYLVAEALARPVTSLFHRTTTELAATMSPGLVPGEAHLTGRKGAQVAAEAPSAEELELDALQAQIDALRGPRPRARA